MTFASVDATPTCILDFDIENRPLSYMGMDYTSAEVTAIAAGWVGENTVRYWLLQPGDLEGTARDMLRQFVRLYDKADMVTGHYIRRHDLPIINASLLEYGFPPLAPKLTSDTKMDLARKKDLSASQESLSDMLGLPEAKHHMSQKEWRLSNRLTKAGIDATRKRVVDDVIQHKALRVALVEQGMLGPPKMWRPTR